MGRLLCLTLQRSVQWTTPERIRQHVQRYLCKLLNQLAYQSYSPARLTSFDLRTVESRRD